MLQWDIYNLYVYYIYITNNLIWGYLGYFGCVWKEMIYPQLTAIVGDLGAPKSTQTLVAFLTKGGGFEAQLVQGGRTVKPC